MSDTPHEGTEQDDPPAQDASLGADDARFVTDTPMGDVGAGLNTPSNRGVRTGALAGLVDTSALAGIQSQINTLAAAVDTSALEAIQSQVNAFADSGIGSVLRSITPALEAGKVLRSLDLAPMLEAGKVLRSLDVAPMLEAAATVRALSEAVRLPDFSWLDTELKAGVDLAPPGIDPAVFRDHKLDALVDLNTAMHQVADVLEKQSHLTEELVDENRLLRADNQLLREAVDQSRREAKRANKWLIPLGAGLFLLAAAQVAAPSVKWSIQWFSGVWHWLFG